MQREMPNIFFVTEDAGTPVFATAGLMKVLKDTSVMPKATRATPTKW